jgi:DNA-binding protein HU-beta
MAAQAGRAWTKTRMVERHLSGTAARVPRRAPDQRQEETQVTKQEFVSEVARRSQLSNRDAGKAVDAFIETITDTLKGGGDVSFTGFGKFSTSNRAARQGVNPRTGERVQIPAARVPKFSAGSSLKQAVKG